MCAKMSRFYGFCPQSRCITICLVHLKAHLGYHDTIQQSAQGKRPHLLRKGGALVHLPGLLLALLLKVIQSVAMPLAVQLNVLALRLHRQTSDKEFKALFKVM